jgi:hypothetical protein
LTSPEMESSFKSSRLALTIRRRTYYVINIKNPSFDTEASVGSIVGVGVASGVGVGACVGIVPDFDLVRLLGS